MFQNGIKSSRVSSPDVKQSTETQNPLVTYYYYIGRCLYAIGKPIHKYVTKIALWTSLRFMEIYNKTIFRALQSSSKMSKSEQNCLSILQAEPYSNTLVLSIEYGQHCDNSLYKFKIGSNLRFAASPSLLGKEISLYCNYPQNGNKFERKTYYKLYWMSGTVIDKDTPSDEIKGFTIIRDTDMSCQIVPKIPGSYHYYIINAEKPEAGPQASGYFMVEPQIIVGSGNNERILHLDSICCQTVLAKLMGPLNTWEEKLKVSQASGYNMIHFTPIQELGASNSSYSISHQRRTNSLFNYDEKEVSFDDIEKIVSKIRDEWNIASICDIVLNHTANESRWLFEHPECTYNCSTARHLRPPYLLDAALAFCNSNVIKGLHASEGVPKALRHENQIQALKHILHTQYLTQINLPELFQVNVTNLEVEFYTLARGKVPRDENACSRNEDELQIIQDSEYRRLGSTVDLELALELFNVKRSECLDEESRLKKCTEEFRRKLENLNNAMHTEIQNHVTAAVENALAGVRYERVQSGGPQIPEVDEKHPLFPKYFTDYGPVNQSLKQQEELMYCPAGRFLMAHNGWVVNSDPLKDFAKLQEGTGNVYLRRELIAWGDSVKLRYGDSPADCPFLWDHMREYVEKTAEIFDGVRLDNCHSTPLHVAEYLLDCARKVKPNLYVVAELFTNSDQTDNIFVNRLGITSLIREAQAAWDSHEQGRLVYRYGGEPVGSFHTVPISIMDSAIKTESNLIPSVAHALFMDVTHDNHSPIEKRSVYDALPTAAMLSMACCAVGSNRGYDELVPHHIHVVNENREYATYNNDTLEDTGIIIAKQHLYNLHDELARKGFSEIFVDQMNTNIVAITRHNPITHDSYILVAYTCFEHPSTLWPDKSPEIAPLKFEGNLDKIILEATIEHKTQILFDKPSEYEQHPEIVNGLEEYELILKENILLNESNMLNNTIIEEGKMKVISFTNFKPGSIVVLKVNLDNKYSECVQNIQDVLRNIHENSDETLANVISKINLTTLNYILYKCDAEERDGNPGAGPYDIPNFGQLVYCGIQGFMSVLSEIRANNNLGHPMCSNLRNGDWMIDYIWKRLRCNPKTAELSSWMEKNFAPIKNLPRYLIPTYFDSMLNAIYKLLLNQSFQQMTDFIKNGSTFVKALSLGSIQFHSVCPSATLPDFSPDLSPPIPLKPLATLSAGLPHFTNGYMRCWGRDTFISLRGLFLLTGRFDEARELILGFAACLRHGLIPNLLDGGKNSRFNCRDAVWWWMYCIRCFGEMVPNGRSILSDRVSRIFPYDDSAPQPAGAVDQPLYDVIQEALQTHFKGLVFRERNAGRTIDQHMTDRGFSNQIGVNPETGFVYGGNEWNCGTWMDKMGSSDKAGNRGVPATPRDGSAVEIVALSYSIISWLASMYKIGVFPYQGVERHNRNGSVTKWNYQHWAEKIASNFEPHFFINEKGEQVNRTKIYKDTVGAGQLWADLQLRCNYSVAMAVAPELFNQSHAWEALEVVRKILLGPLGLKTLDPSDWNYCGVYDNSNDSEDIKIAQGFNYHQGPEWVWPIGYYLRARLHFAKLNNCLKETIKEIRTILSAHLYELQTSPWRGIPELTNENGTYCRDSCRTQAWSMASVLEVLYDIEALEKCTKKQN